MVAVHYPAMLVTDPHTGMPLTAVRGEQGTVVERGTDTPVPLTEDAEGNIALPNPLTVSPEGFTPPFYVQVGLTRVDFVSGTWRTPLWSPQGLEAAAATAAQAAQDAADAAALAAQAAQAAADLVDAPADAALAVILADAESAAHQAVVAIAQQFGGGGGDAAKDVLHSTRVFDEDSLTWPPRAEGYAYDIAYGPETPEPPGALVGDVHWIPR